MDGSVCNVSQPTLGTWWEGGGQGAVGAGSWGMVRDLVLGFSTYLANVQPEFGCLLHKYRISSIWGLINWKGTIHRWDI